MQEKTWWKEAIVYQIYPRSFQDTNQDGIGDIKGIISRLDYIKKLGADVIWLCPLYDSPNDDNGYDIRDYQSILKEFGTMEDFDELLKKAHEMKLKIIMDLVVNHTSDEHRWFQESRSSKDSPYRDYYIWRPAINGHEPNPWESNFGGSAWEFDEETQEYYLHLFSKKQPDLNWDCEALRKDIYKMMRWWLDKGIDGFRMDVISYISKDEKSLTDEKQPRKTTAANGPRVHEYLKEMNEHVLSHYDIMCVGENPDATVEEARKYAGLSSKELNMIFQFQLMDVDGGESTRWGECEIKLRDVKEIFTKWQLGLHETAWNSLFWNNHDQPRAVSRFGDDSTPFYREKSAKMLATCLHMMQGTPYIYQGEEIGMTNVKFYNIHDYQDIETIQAYKQYIAKGVSHESMMSFIHYRSRDNARTPMQWDKGVHAGFTKGTPWLKENPNYIDINVEDSLNDKSSIFYYYHNLIKLRKQHEIIVYGSYELLDKENPYTFIYKRYYQGKELLILCNFTKEKQPFDIHLIHTDAKVLIDNYDKFEKDVLSPYEARVYISKELSN